MTNRVRHARPTSIFFSRRSRLVVGENIHLHHVQALHYFGGRQIVKATNFVIEVTALFLC